MSVSPSSAARSCSLVKIAFQRVLGILRRNKVDPNVTLTPSNGLCPCHKTQESKKIELQGVHELASLVDIELEEQFKIVDLNNDGYIDGDELKKVMRNMGVQYTDEEIESIIQQADINGSGKIEEDDFMKVMSEYLTAEKDESFDVRDLFDVFDTDKDGFISQNELQYAIRELLQDSTISKKEVSTMMRHACKGSSKSKNTMISFRDFQLLLDDVGFSA